MDKPRLEVADVLREHGESYRQQAAALSPEQSRVMHAVQVCRTAALGGHRRQCDRCGHEVIAYNSCRNRHCPKCQSLAKARWLEARRAELLPVDYYHVVFTIPDPLLAPLALQNKRVVYDILLAAAADSLRTIGADPKHLGARLGFMAVLHTWSQTLGHHPHVHAVVPGGGLTPDGDGWVACRRGFLLPVAVLSRRFRRVFLDRLEAAFAAGRLAFHGALTPLADPAAFARRVQACRQIEWNVYAKPPCAGGPDQVLDYLARYTHRVAIANHRLVRMQHGKVTFTYRADAKHKQGPRGATRRTMTLQAHEFIRRFLMHVLPDGFVRIRYYGFLANARRAENLARIRRLLHVPETTDTDAPDKVDWATLLETLTGQDPLRCPHCGQGRLATVQVLAPSSDARARASPGGAWP